VQDFGPHPLHQEVFRNAAAVFDRYMAMDVSSAPDEKGSGDDDEAGR